jgi:hypothetical protein
MAKKMIHPIRSEADYEAAVDEIEQYFDNEPKPDTSEAHRFDSGDVEKLALILFFVKKIRCRISAALDRRGGGGTARRLSNPSPR